MAASDNRGLRSEAEVRLKRYARKDVHVIVLTALGVLDENAGAVAITALRRWIGTEIAWAGGEAAVILDPRQRIADRHPIGLERGFAQLKLGMFQRELYQLRRLVGLTEVVIGAADLILFLHHLHELLSYRALVFAGKGGGKRETHHRLTGKLRHRRVRGRRGRLPSNPRRDSDLECLLGNTGNGVELAADRQHLGI